MFNIVEDGDKHLVFRHSKGRRVRVLVSAIMDDSVHIEVETVELWNPILRDKL